MRDLTENSSSAAKKKSIFEPFLICSSGMRDESHFRDPL